MSSEEQERLKKLRERQLQARDPLTNQRKFQRSSAVKEKRMRKRFSFIEAWKKDFRHVFKTPLYFLILGIIITVILQKFWNSPYAFITGAGATLIFIVFGVFLGSSLDLRDEIKNNIK